MHAKYPSTISINHAYYIYYMALDPPNVEYKIQTYMFSRSRDSPFLRNMLPLLGSTSNGVAGEIYP